MPTERARASPKRATPMPRETLTPLRPDDTAARSDGPAGHARPSSATAGYATGPSTMSTAMAQAACGWPPPKLPGTPDGKPGNDPRPAGDGAPRDRWHRRSRQADHRAGLRGPEHQ